MKRVILILALIFIVGCAQCPDCVCPTVQPTVEYRDRVVEQKVTEYVCSNNAVVSDPGLCPEEVPAVVAAPAKYVAPIIKLETGNVDGKFVMDAKIQPACVQAKRGFAVYYKLGQVGDANIRIKEYPGQYTVLDSINDKYDDWNNYLICEDTDCPKYTTYKNLMAGKIYIVQMEFTMPSGAFKSDEYVLDTRDGSPYMTQRCS